MSENKIISKEIEFEGKKLVLETGKLATMTNMSVKASYGDTVILITAVSGGYNPDIDFFPLTINYQEKFYASGSVKSSRFQKRDGRSTDEAIIAGRIIDHAIRPLFPNDFMDEVQIVISVLSLDQECDAELLSMIGVSAALQASDIPWGGPMVSARVGYIDGEYVLAPGLDVLHDKSDLDMMVSFCGDDKKFLAVEAEANILPEEKILGAVEFARNSSDGVYNLIKEFASEVNPENKKYEYESKAYDPELVAAVTKIAGEEVKKAMSQGLDKDILNEKFSEISEEIVTSLEGKFKKVDMLSYYDVVKKEALQQQILDTEVRPDGRGIKEVRPITCEVGVLPRTHGSALFSRGLTQVLTTATLASPSQELLIQDMYGERSKKYLHYYNFPPFASGETGRMGYPKNREIGHGMIGENALRPVVPTQDEFPYMIMLVSESLSSSGSTSMASTCGSTLALMDAGVPISDMVAGIGVGLIADPEFKKQLIMTDLAYMEDAFGLLDFKMTGTRTGVTAIQSDMKAPGIPIELLPKIIEQSKEGRLFILDIMEKLISKPREDVSKYAPKTVSIHIDPEKIGAVIGSGGKVIKEIQAKTETEVSIEEDGTVVVSSVNLENSKRAAEIIANMTKDVKAGEIYDGVIEEVVDFGAFVEILPGKVGLLHISEVSNDYVQDIHDVLKAGDEVKVKVLEVSRDGKMSLSKRILEPGAENSERNDRGDRGDRDNRGGNRGGRGSGRNDRGNDRGHNRRN